MEEQIFGENFVDSAWQEEKETEDFWELHAK